jgi:hypothetical protein
VLRTRFDPDTSLIQVSRITAVPGDCYMNDVRSFVVANSAGLCAVLISQLRFQSKRFKEMYTTHLQTRVHKTLIVAQLHIFYEVQMLIAVFTIARCWTLSGTIGIFFISSHPVLSFQLLLDLLNDLFS